MSNNFTTHVTNHSLEIRNEFKAGVISKLNVGLSFAKGSAECTIEAKESEENGYGLVLYLTLKSPIICSVALCRFALTIKVGNIPFSMNDKRISSCSIISKLQSMNDKPLTLVDLNSVLNQARAKASARRTERTKKIFFEAILVIRCMVLSPLQQVISDIAAPDLADFTFNVHDEYFPAHKSILLSRSPVLARMLSNSNYIETQQSIMKISDCSKKTFMLFLQFMYGGNIPGNIAHFSLNDTIELIKIAEKYQTTELKKNCENMLLENLSEADPVHNVYQFLNQYNCSKEVIKSVFSLVQRKYFLGIALPEKLCEMPNEVQRLVEKMEEFNKTLKQVNESVI